MAQGTWAELEPVGTRAGEQDRVFSWAKRFLNLLKVSNYYCFL